MARVASWYDAIPDGVMKELMAILKDMKALKEITFLRTKKLASWDNRKNPILMVFLGRRHIYVQNPPAP
jgi:hypothetical protein